jgi:hypothetical protein
MRFPARVIRRTTRTGGDETRETDLQLANGGGQPQRRDDHDAAAAHCEPKTGGAELFFAVSTATPAIRHAKVIKAIAIR